MLELSSAVILAVTAVATSWAGFQAVRWGGVQSERFSEAGLQRAEANEVSATVGLRILVDIGLFLNWIDAAAAGDSVRAKFLRDRFRPDFRPAFEAWLATKPLHSSRPTTPFERPEYNLPEQDEVRRLERDAETTFDEGMRANDRTDSYSMIAVILACSLFFVGIAPQLRKPKLRMIIIGLAGLLCAAALVTLVILPVA
jgi:hypothetical protein